MAYALEPARAMQDDVRRVARERLDDALGRLAGVQSGADRDVETAVHETRKRCKEMRGLARLVRPALGDGFATFDRTVRAAANELSAMRDAHALLGTVDALLAGHDGDDELRSVRDHQASIADATTESVERGDVRVERARALLIGARELSQHWELRPGFAELGAGLAATYRRGRRELRRSQAEPTDHRIHEWRKSVKYLWYQARLLHHAAPSVLGPLVERLDVLADALGDDHDLAVLVEQFDRDSDRFGEAHAVDHVRSMAREHQRLLREQALRAGATIYAEKPAAFAQRIGSYWTLTVRRGHEPPLGGLATLGAGASATATTDAGDADDQGPPDAGSAFERERVFLLDHLPDHLDVTGGHPPEGVTATPLRQGYLAIGERASVRVRDAGGEYTLTVKAGRGSERVELEWPIGRDQFEAAWPHTDGLRVEKTRHRVDVDGHTVELDVFAGDLDGLVLAEVEFDSMDDLEAYTPPDWFGTEVTDDDRYANASLARDGRPT